MKLDEKYFQTVSFNDSDISKLIDNAFRDLSIAQNDKYTEVKFNYAYQSILKIGIAILAKCYSVRVRSRPGHHIRVLQVLSDALNDSDVFDLADIMRQKRHADLYDGGEVVTEKEAEEYVAFASQVLKLSAKLLELD